MKNKTSRFLVISLVLASILCVGLFTFLAFFMGQRSTETIGTVGQFYMESMSEQITLHFQTTVGLRLDQVEAMVNDIPTAEERNGDHESVQSELSYSAQARGFERLALLSADGTFEMIHGDRMRVVDPEPFLASLRNGESKVAVGVNESGEQIVLLGVPARYCLKSEEPAIALVASLPVSYITKTLSLDENNAKVYSYVIRKNGSFVIRTGDAFRESYFERVRELYEDVDGQTPEQYIEELSASMQREKPYSSAFRIGGEQRYLYCAKLPYSEWYLLTSMPYSAMDGSIDALNEQWSVAAILGCLLVLVTLLMIFIVYSRMTRHQLRELALARQTAEAATRAKGDFLSNMSHDIRTPMNAIVGMTAIAMANIENEQQVRDCLKKISLSSKHLLGLINDVLDMSKIESGKMTLTLERVSLREVMDSIVSIVQPQVKTKRQNFSVSIHDISTENVYCDSVRLNQVLLNFLSNAVKFTPEGGVIELTLNEEPSPVSENHVRVHLAVKDSGIGMSPEFQEKIFESFAREENRVRKTEGSGLGMAIAKYIVDAMGGTIEVESEVGKGTQFHVTLDMERAEELETEMVLPAWNMLVVDDDRQLCESAVAALHSFGVRAEWALDGESALEMVKRRHGTAGGYQVILLDWKLPGIDGIQTARRIREQLEDDIPILLISAYDWAEIEEEARAAGVNGFISKPLFKSTLYHSLRAYMDDSKECLVPEEEQPSRLAGKRILLAEDNDLNWEIAEALLSELGVELDRAENGEICVEKFRNAPAAYYDAILMDIRMPVMTGYEATVAIRALDREDATLPIIAMTADAFAEDVKKALDSGMNAHVAKPIEIRELSRLLEKYIG